MLPSGTLRSKSLAGLILFPALTLPAQSQEPAVIESGEASVRVFGEVVDRRSGEPVPLAAISLLPFAGQVSAAQAIWTGQSDAMGRFRTETISVGAYRLDVRVLPFSELTYVLVLPEEGLVDLRVEMVGVDYQLEPIVASARRMTKLQTEGFYDRQQAGIGTFMARGDIDASMARSVSDLFRSVPGATIVQGSGLAGNRVGLRGGCTPLFVVDGLPLTGPVAIDNLMHVNDVEGVEVYHRGSVPIQYAGQTTCGAVVLWSRDPVTTEGGAPSWKRVLAAVGVGALVLIGVR